MNLKIKNNKISIKMEGQYVYRCLSLVLVDVHHQSHALLRSASSSTLHVTVLHMLYLGAHTTYIYFTETILVSNQPVAHNVARNRQSCGAAPAATAHFTAAESAKPKAGLSTKRSARKDVTIMNAGVN